jgi:hypothetical protein
MKPDVRFFPAPQGTINLFLSRLSIKSILSLCDSHKADFASIHGN